jgi:putative lumazine-binding protein
VIHVQAQSKLDADLIKQTALDYIEGWYEADAVRMERALHPDLAKRIVRIVNVLWEMKPTPAPAQ